MFWKKDPEKKRNLREVGPEDEFRSSSRRRKIANEDFEGDSSEPQQ
jgi:hypothetical protein